MSNLDFKKTKEVIMVWGNETGPTITPVREIADLYAQVARIRETLGGEEPLIRETFSREFAGQLPALLNKDFKLQNDTHVNFQTIIDKHLTKISVALNDAKNISRAQQEFVRELVKTFAQLPVKTWNISPRQLVEDGAANCSTAGAALQMIIESTRGSTGITNIDYVNPPGHACNMVQFPDGSIFFADPRNGVFENITTDVTKTKMPGMTMYELRAPTNQIPFRYIPALSSSVNGMVLAYLGNISEIPDLLAGKFPPEFADVSAEERAAMQIEARALADRPEITPENIQKTRATHDRLHEPIAKFFRELK